jgi:hypothetical protein
LLEKLLVNIHMFVRLLLELLLTVKHVLAKGWGYCNDFLPGTLVEIFTHSTLFCIKKAMKKISCNDAVFFSNAGKYILIFLELDIPRYQKVATL